MTSELVLHLFSSGGGRGISEVRGGSGRRLTESGYSLSLDYNFIYNITKLTNKRVKTTVNVLLKYRLEHICGRPNSLRRFTCNVAVEACLLSRTIRPTLVIHKHTFRLVGVEFLYLCSNMAHSETVFITSSMVIPSM